MPQIKDLAMELWKKLKNKSSVLLEQQAIREKKKNEVNKKNEISDESKSVLFDLENKLSEKFKAPTEEGKERMRRLISIVFHKIRSYTLIPWFYSHYCLYLSYVLGFQSDKPLIDKVYHMQMDCVKRFFSNFIKPNMFAKCKTGSHFLHLDLNEGNLLPKKLIFAASKDQTELTILMLKTLAGKGQESLHRYTGLHIKETTVRKSINEVMQNNQYIVGLIC